MPKRPTRENDDVFSFDPSTETKTLEDVYNIEKQNAKALAKLRSDLWKDSVKQQERALKNMYIEVEQTINQAKLDGVKNVVELEKKLKQEALEKESRERLKRQNDLYKKELEQIKNDPRYKGTKEKVGEWNRQYKENQELLRMYEKIGENNLTKEQKADRDRRAQEQKELNSKAVEQQLMQGMVNAMQNLADSVNRSMSKYAELHRGTNARLQGYRGNSLLDIGLGIIPDKYGYLEDKLSSAVGVNPYFKTETMLTNLSNLINEGIAANVEQRAFLQTASENIANTFNVANASLLRIVRLQQQDSSAARLGMEARLTSYLNSMFENTEYLNKTFDNVTDALVEASSHMSIQGSTELEYVVQKWLGSLVSVGMSESTVTNIAQALGQLGSGNIEALTNSNMLNLLTMASSKSNMDIGGILKSGLNADTADVLLNNLVAYLVDIERSGNNVVKSQLANTFGITYSDLAAAANLSSSMNNIYGKNMSFNDMYLELAEQLMMVPFRMNTTTRFDNLWSNLEFGVGKGIASSPALAAIWKVTDMIQQNTGGINIPFINAMGFGVDLNTSVENLVKLGLVGVSSMGMIGEAISGMVTSLAPASTLLKLGILPGFTGISRGSGLSTFSSGLSTSASTVQQVGQGSGEAIQQSVTKQAEYEAQESSGANDEDEEEMKKATLNIYKYLRDDVQLKEKLDTLIGYIDGVESKLADIEMKIHSGV